jgi:predicted histidine transporter YuiF (NhaC family)
MVKESYPIHTLLIGLGITVGIGTGIGGIASSASYYNQLSADLTNDIE